MGLLIFMQVVLDLGFIAATTWLLIDRSKSKTMEDPRLSRGLQLLSSKIAILQDLMDRSESMSRQLNQLIDGKQADIQERMEEFEIYLHKIQKATEKSQEVVDIFQDRVPHQEMIERQTSAKYLMAAKMANQGISVEEISRQVDIPRGELELICKVNRDRLIIESDSELESESDENSAHATPEKFAIQTIGSVAMATSSQVQAAPKPVSFAPPVSNPAAANVSVAALAAAAAARSISAAPIPAKKQEKEIRPVIFKRISVLDDLG